MDLVFSLNSNRGNSLCQANRNCTDKRLGTYLDAAPNCTWQSRFLTPGDDKRLHVSAVRHLLTISGGGEKVCAIGRHGGLISFLAASVSLAGFYR
jgi:hypothetical protein